MRIFRDIHRPILALIVTNIFALVHLPPVWFQLLVDSCGCVYVGAILSIRIVTKQEKRALLASNPQDSSFKMLEAFKFPLIGSAFLIGMHLLYKFTGKQILNSILILLFSLSAVITTTKIIRSQLQTYESLNKTLIQIQLHPAIKRICKLTNIVVNPALIISSVACTAPIILFCFSRHWLLNNIYAIFFAINAIKFLNLQSFKVGFTLLWLLFFYDLFWVYGTDVMVTVAQNIDIPIKIMFPREGSFSLLGLGDIVIPGAFISLCAKYDVDRSFEKDKPKTMSEVSLRYFRVCFMAYVIGISFAFIGQHILDHPQPALIYLVPMCTFSPLILAIYSRQLTDFMAYRASEKKNDKAGSAYRALNQQIVI